MRFVAPLVIVRRFLLWTAICGVSAAPSFMFGQMLNAAVWGMVGGVALFIFGYTLFTSTIRFDRFLHQMPFVRSTMYVGYGLRLLLSLLGIAAASQMFSRGVFRGPATPYAQYVSWPDMMCGAWSIRIVQAIDNTLMGDDALGFPEAFLITCVQGAILNVIVFIVMAIVYGLQRAFRTVPVLHRRGFDVLPADRGDQP